MFFSLLTSALALLTLSSCLSRQYYFVNKNMNWTEAQTFCRQNYTDLATFENANTTNSLIAAAVNISYNGLAWIGLYDDVINGWRWYLDDDTLYGPGEKNYRNWANPQPDNFAGNEMCAQIYPQGGWNDIPCRGQLHTLCYNKTTNSHVLINSTSGFLNASAARQYCRQHYTDLSIIRNQSENQMITNLLVGIYQAWIGLYRTRQWSDQSNSTYENWLTGQPDNQGGVQHCTAASLSNSGQWSDENCNRTLPFFCYKDSLLTTQTTTVGPQSSGPTSGSTGTITGPLSSEPSKENVMRLRVRFTSGRNLTDAEIENVMLLQLQNQLINKGLPSNTTLRLKKVLN